MNWRILIFVALGIFFFGQICKDETTGRTSIAWRRVALGALIGFLAERATAGVDFGDLVESIGERVEDAVAGVEDVVSGALEGAKGVVEG